MNTEDLDELIEQAEEALQAMWSPPSGLYRPEHAFMSRFFQLALLLERDAAARSDPRLQQFLQACRSELAWAALPLEACARDLDESVVEPWDIGAEMSLLTLDRWADVCRRRSALEFLADHFPNLPFLSEEGALRQALHKVDAALRAKVERGEAIPHPEQAPEGTPASHWWWRCEGC